MTSAFHEALSAAGPHPSLGAHAETYGRLIGSWTGEVRNLMVKPQTTASLEIHFGWVLDGRAVQDTWITPARAERAGVAETPMNWYGTTLRVFDPKSESWRALWWNPVAGTRIELEGWRQGDDIVQIGTRLGRPIKWTFTQMKPESFLWSGYILETDGKTWRPEVEIPARRKR